jgi:CHASE2 domain-containing sensor protein/tetratricopeptide (TPR) repeat protein
VINLLRDKRYAWIPAATAAALVFAIGTWVAPGLVRSLELTVYDRAIRSGSATPPRDIVIVAVDEASIAKLGAWPWPRSIHTRLLERLTESGASLIAFDMSMGQSQARSGLDQLRAAIQLLETDSANSEQTERLKALLDQSVSNLDEDAGLAHAMEKHGNVLLPIEARIDTKDTEGMFAALDMRAPAEQLTGRARGLGHLVLQTDTDGVMRSDLTMLSAGENALPSLALAIAARLRGVEIGQVRYQAETGVIVGEQTLPVDSQLRWSAVFYPASGERSIPQYSYWDVLGGVVKRDQLHGKAVVIGVTDARTAQLIRTPVGELPTVIATAGLAGSLVTAQGYSHPAWATAIEWLLALGLIALCAWFLPSLGLTIGSVATGMLVVALILVEVGLLNVTGVWLRLALPALIACGALLGLFGLAALKRWYAPRAQGGDAIDSLRQLGLTFQGQGQLDLALETFRRCPNDTQTLDLLYGLGQDYEKRRQFAKASEVYTQITASDSHYKDANQRRDRIKRAEQAQAAPPVRGAQKTAERSERPGPRAVPQAAQPRVAVEDFESVIAKPRPKQTLGRYEIERELGKGAMGVVYFGRDPKINRVVAIKAIALAEEFAEEDVADARARFFREAEMAGRLNHPNIVTVYDAGEDRGLAYIAMEFLKGEHLSHYAEPIRLLPVARVLSLAARVADALDYAHKQNVVHRDIKPANIMFNADTDELKLTDFGIARLTDTSRTKTGIVLGTPSFMSPEQLEGRPLDGRSDLFALGITLYQLLTGQLPFRAESMTRLMHKIAMDPHVPLRSLRPELPEMAEQIMSRALAKSTADRFQTGAEMAVALRTCIRLVTRKEAIAR